MGGARPLFPSMPEAKNDDRNACLQPLEQLIPRAIQSAAQACDNSDSREFRPAFDLLEITAAYIGFLGQHLLRERTRSTKPVYIFAERVDRGASHGPTLTGTILYRSAL